MKRILLLTALALVGCKKKTTDATPAPSASTPPAVSVSATASPPTPAPPTTGVAPGVVSDVHCVGTPTGETIVHSHDAQATVWTESELATLHTETKAWLCFQRSGQQKVLLMSRAARADAGVEDELNDFSQLVFSRDDRVVFFATSAWVVSPAAHGVEVATGKEWFIVDGSIIEELDHGPFKGSLYATHFRLDDEHPVGDIGYLGRNVTQTVVDWHGKKLRRLPDNEKERKKVLDGK